MPYAQHFRLSWGGTLFGGIEQWSCSLKMSKGGLATNTDRVGFAIDRIDDVYPKVLTYFQSVTSGHHRASKLVWVKFVPIGEDGKYEISGTTPEYRWVTPQTPGVHTSSTTADLPTQMALVISQRSTVRTRGRGSHGRWYNPPATFPVAAPDGCFSGAIALTLATAAKDFIVNLNNWTSPPADAPEVAMVSGIDTQTTPVNSVRVGNAYDVHRSRDRQLVETYQIVSF